MATSLGPLGPLAIEPDSAVLAAELWSLGMTPPHPGCIYQDGDRDADYENACEICRDHLAGVAEIVVRDWLPEILGLPAGSFSG